MMDFEEFKYSVMENIRHFLPERYADAAITLQEVTKNNDQKLTGLLIRTENGEVTPIIYLDQYYEQYQAGQSMDDIFNTIAAVRTADEIVEHFDRGSIADFEHIKDKIICKLVNAEMNEEYLSDKPHKQIEDLAVMYAIDLGSNYGGHMTAPVTESMMKRYGLGIHELHEIALHNLSESSIEFKSMKDIIIEMMFPDGIPENYMMASLPFSDMDAIPMYVLTNAEGMNGAAAVLDKRTMESIAVQFGGDFVVIPSSIHEVIVLPFTEDLSQREIEQIIRDVNAEHVAPDERLSDHAYKYDSKLHKLVRMNYAE